MNDYDFEVASRTPVSVLLGAACTRVASILALSSPFLPLGPVGMVSQVCARWRGECLTNKSISDAVRSVFRLLKVYRIMEGSVRVGAEGGLNFSSRSVELLSELLVLAR